MQHGEYISKYAKNIIEVENVLDQIKSLSENKELICDCKHKRDLLLEKIDSLEQQIEEKRITLCKLSKIFKKKQRSEILYDMQTLFKK